MKNILWMLFMIPFCAHAQSGLETSLLRKSLWRFTVFKPGLANELRLGRNVTLASSANLWGGYSSEKGAGLPSVTQYDIIAQANTGLRYYYNLGHRIAGGKSVRYNSGNYLSVSTRYNSKPLVQWEAD